MVSSKPHSCIEADNQMSNSMYVASGTLTCILIMQDEKQFLIGQSESPPASTWPNRDADRQFNPYNCPSPPSRPCRCGICCRYVYSQIDNMYARIRLPERLSAITIPGYLRRGSPSGFLKNSIIDPEFLVCAILPYYPDGTPQIP